MKIGILGGTFNPPHLGHFMLAQTALEKLELDKVFFIPTNKPPHKEMYPIEAKHRLIMLEGALETKPKFILLDWELARDGVSYTIDTLKRLKDEYPEDDFFLIIGSDLANYFETWKDYKEILSLVKVAVGKRNSSPLKSDEGFLTFDITQMDITSSQIRERIESEFSIKGFVPDSVYDYVDKNKLYGNKKPIIGADDKSN